MIERQQTTWTSGSLALLLLLFIGLAVVLPLVLLVSASLPPDPGGLEALRTRLIGAPLRQAFLHTVGVALLACALASAVAVPVAVAAARGLRSTWWLLGILGVLPLAIPPFLGAALLEQFAAVYNQTAAAGLFGAIEVRGSSLVLGAVYALHYFPFILFSLAAGLRRIPPDLEDSARNLGAGRLTVWRRILLPLATPAYVTGATVLVLKVLEDVGTPLVLGVDQMLAPQLLLHLGQGGLGDPQLQVTALALLLVSMVVTVLGWSALLPALGSEVRPDEAPRRPGGVAARLLSVAAALILALITLAPLAWLALLAFDAQWTGAAWPTDLRVPPAADLLGSDPRGASVTPAFAAATGLLTLLIALAATSAGMARTPLTRLARFTSAAMFAVPGVVLAVGHLHLSDLAGRFAPDLPGLAWVSLVVVVALKQLPLAQRALAEPLARLGRGGLDAARGIGVTGPALHWRITLPALSGILGAVFLLAAAAAALELSAALVLISDPQAPVALRLFDTIRHADGAATWAAQGLLLALSAATAAVLALILLRPRIRRPGMHRHDPPLRDQA